MPIEKLRPEGSLNHDTLKDLAQLVPETFADGRINWTVLRELLNERLEDEELTEEHFGLFWPGKREARRLANKPSTGTLVPSFGEGVNEAETGNIFIEGENLEVLKILRKSYAGRIKMIYIDPPYNTGNDFVYDDDFAEPLQDYLKRTGQIDGEGSPLTTNKKADGRFHSKWLSMIYPRLRLARELLQEDGVIFVSIDDNEVHHFRMVMNEVFGEENYRNTISVRRGIKNVQAQFDDLSALSQGHEYIMVFSKYADTRLPKLFLSHGEQRPGKWDTFWRGTDRPTMRYELFGVNPERGQWRWEEHRTKNAIQNYVFYLNQIAGRMTLDEWYLDNLTATNTKLNFVRKNEEGVVQYYVPPTAGKL